LCRLKKPARSSYFSQSKQEFIADKQTQYPIERGEIKIETLSNFLLLFTGNRVLGLLLLAKLKMLCTLDWLLRAILATLAFQSQHNLLSRLCLLVKDRLGLSTKSGLLSIVTTLSCCTMFRTTSNISKQQTLRKQ
jgi:hypothetical protein